jgi:exopolysaccharide biosynthesis polyprenyl glycosylphosphotransferase
MRIHGSHSRHWNTVSLRFGMDAILVFISFYAASVFRFSMLQPPKFSGYLPNVVLATLLLPSVIYIMGLYSSESLHQKIWQRGWMLFCAFAITIFFVLAYGSLDYTARVGRGVLGVALVLATTAVYLHHGWIQMVARLHPNRMGFLVACEEDEAAVQQLIRRDKRHVSYVGMIGAGGYRPMDGTSDLGSLEETAPEHWVRVLDTLVCTSSQIHNQALAKAVRNLRYRGVTVISVLDAFEELFHMVPLQTVDESWLLQVSALPGSLYVRKVKRAFDVIAALILLIILGPICLVAMAIIRLGSTGPVVFRQDRVGRFGRVFTVFKLRSMRVDAEAAGPQWSRANDQRVTWFGGFLRKYRIDEIPQVVNVLRGEMSFVGPRPERPEFVSDLEAQIPFFNERLMLQPGLTGWAQVRYPYGATVDDARRKLEFDLYYLKHMSVFLDLFILLDTVRTVLLGVQFVEADQLLKLPVLEG